MFNWDEYIGFIGNTIDSFYLDFVGGLMDIKQPDDDAVHGQKELLLNVFRVAKNDIGDEEVEEFVQFCISHEISFMFVFAELMAIARCVMGEISERKEFETLSTFNSSVDRIEKKLLSAYLEQFLRKLAVKNHIRLSHLSNLVEKNLMIHYQEHLEWMIALVAFIRDESTKPDSVQIDHTKCSFGRWLHNDVSTPMRATSHFKDVERQHVLLHQLAKEVLNCKHQGNLETKTVLHVMQKIDYLSLEIGNEIAIINDMLLLSEYSKDPLTGLLTRRLFDKVLTSQIEIAKATETNCAMIMCDLDHFKAVNDTHGHLAGDEVIKNFSELLKRVFRKSDFLFRFGGEEFLLILPSTNYKNALSIANKLCEETRVQEIFIAEELIRYTVSIGVIQIEAENITCVTKDTINSYVYQVDSKLYLAKNSGRNKVN